MSEAYSNVAEWLMTGEMVVSRCKDNSMIVIGSIDSMWGERSMYFYIAVASQSQVSGLRSKDAIPVSS